MNLVDTQTRAPAEEPLPPAHAKAVAAIETLLASMQAAAPETDADAVLSHVASAQAILDSPPALVASPGDNGAVQDAPSSDQIKSFANELQQMASRSQETAGAFIERFTVSRILRGATFVGHVNTDLDSIAGAIGAANLYQGTAAKAQRELNGEITYALEFAGLPEPALFDDLGEDARSRVCLVDHNEEKQVRDVSLRPPRPLRHSGAVSMTE